MFKVGDIVKIINSGRFSSGKVGKIYATRSEYFFLEFNGRHSHIPYDSNDLKLYKPKEIKEEDLILWNSI